MWTTIINEKWNWTFSRRFQIGFAAFCCSWRQFHFMIRADCEPMNNCLLQQIVQSGSSFVGSLDERLDVISKWQQVKTFIPSPDYISLREFLWANINILSRWFKIMKIISRSPYWKRNLIFIFTLDRSRSAGTQIVIRWGEVCSPDSQLSGAINIFHLWYCAFVLCEKLHCSDSLEIFLHNNNDKRYERDFDPNSNAKPQLKAE